MRFVINVCISGKDTILTVPLSGVVRGLAHDKYTVKRLPYIISRALSIEGLF
jgi:hypothetical protein